MGKMGVAERNKAIKKLLSKEFGYKNVKVRGGRGTAYGWVEVTITVPKPHDGECDGGHYPSMLCDECIDAQDEARRRVWELLEESGLIDEIGVYYDDMGNKWKEIIINVVLDEKLRNKEKDTDEFKIKHEGTWTWIYFKIEPSDEIKEIVKSLGFRYSLRRGAWYSTEKKDIDAVIEKIKEVV